MDDQVSRIQKRNDQSCFAKTSLSRPINQSLSESISEYCVAVITLDDSIKCGKRSQTVNCPHSNFRYLQNQVSHNFSQSCGLVIFMRFFQITHVRIYESQIGVKFNIAPCSDFFFLNGQDFQIFHFLPVSNTPSFSSGEEQQSGGLLTGTSPTLCKSK